MQSLVAFLFSVGVCVLYSLYTRWRRLSSVPGPLLARTTDLWRAWYQYNGKIRGELLKLHERHGPLVRYGVRSVSVSDPSIVDIVYGSRAGFPTADSYNVLAGISNGQEVRSLVSTSDEARHGAMRRTVNGAFTAAAVLDYEPHIDETILELVDMLAGKSTFDLSSTMVYFTMDSASRFSFGEPLGYLKADADVDGTIKVIRARFDHWNLWSSMPSLERLVFRNPISMRLKQTPSSIVVSAMKHLQAQAAKGDVAPNVPNLLWRFLGSGKENPKILDTAGIIGMLMSMISGAADTTATTMTAALYHLMKDPAMLAKLEHELATHDLDLPVPQYAQVSKLPYLQGVIRETMRLFPLLAGPLERRVPVGGISIAGVFLEEGTSVGCFPPALHLNKSVFGEDAHVFRPERWIEVDANRLRVMEAVHMGFSRGRRVCIGQHIAVLQMKKTLTALLLKFKFSLVLPDAALHADFAGAIACMEPLQVQLELKR